MKSKQKMIALAPATAAPTDEEVAARTAAQQLEAIRNNLRQRAIQDRTAALVEEGLKAAGIDLEAVHLDTVAKQRLTEMEAHDQMKAANAKAKDMYQAKFGREFENTP